MSAPVLGGGAADHVDGVGASVPRGAGAARTPEEEGWTRRFVAAPDRLQEAVALYRGMGLEVRLERLPSEELGPGCEGCALALSLFRVIYTRRHT